MHAFQLLADEHQSLAAMLHAMHFTLKEIAAGRLSADAALLRAMAHYLTAYPQHCHHPREERLLFERLRARTDAGDAVLAELQAAHDASAEHGRTLHTALDAYLAGGDIHTLSAAFDQWADFYRGLMLREEQQLLPLLRAHLSADDWAAMDAEADPPSAEFTALFSRLVAAAPAPVGLGQGPYVEPAVTPSTVRSPVMSSSVSEAATSRFVRIREGDLDLQLHYHDCGQGAETVVMLHGSGPGASGWANFNRNIDPLVNAGYRVVLMDCPGWSKSDPIVCTGSRSELNARALKGLLDALAIDKAHILGNSMGGHSAVAFALAHPSRVGKLVLMGVGTGGPSQSVPMPTEGIKLLQALYREPTIDNLKKMMSVFVFDSSSLTEALFQTRLDNMLARRDHLENFVKSLAANPKQFTDYGPRLSEITAPALIIWGRDDRFVPLDIGLRLLWGLGNAQLHVFNRCGHWAQWEHAEVFNRLVRDFLRD